MHLQLRLPIDHPIDAKSRTSDHVKVHISRDASQRAREVAVGNETLKSLSPTWQVMSESSGTSAYQYAGCVEANARAASKPRTWCRPPVESAGRSPSMTRGLPGAYASAESRCHTLDP